MKIAKRILLTFVVAILLSVATLFIIALAYENEVKSYMIRELNKNLKTQVVVDSTNIHLSLFRNFPYASLEFREITILGSPTSASHNKKTKLLRDTLFSASRVGLQFNLLDLLKKNYIVKVVSAENGNLKLHKRADGSVNWDMWKTSEDTVGSENSAFNLERFRLDNISVIYLDSRNKTDISLRLNYATIRGEFKSKEYDLTADGNLFMHYFKIDSVNYLSNQTVRADLALGVDNEKNIYQFSNALVQVADLKISVEGSFTDNESSYTDIHLKGKDMDIESVLSVLPESYRSHISDYDSEGEFYFSSSIKGKWDETTTPKISAEFGMKNASIVQLSTGIALTQVELRGRYASDKQNNFIEASSFSASLIDGNVNGNFRVDHFASPYANISAQAILPVESVRQFFKIDTLWNYPIESLSGTMKLDIQYKGALKNSSAYTKEDFTAMNLGGELVLEDAGMRIKNSALAFDNINASLALQDNNIEVKAFSGKTASSDFDLKGVLKNVLAFMITGKEDINIDASLRCRSFDLNEFLVNNEETTKRDTVYRVRFSPLVNFRLNTSIGQLAFRKFRASNISGTFQLRDRKLIGDPLSFSTMNGTVAATGMIDNSTDSLLLITCNAHLKRLNITQLFEQMEDFGQSTLSHHHLKGIGTAEVQFASVWKTDLTPDLHRMYARNNLLIEKGELLKFEPMKALSRYISISELEEIKFSTLQNQVEIRDRKIFIPKMDIQSSALDVTMHGTHTFNNEIDYHFKVAMSDVLFNKARKAKKENSEFGVVEDDKSGRTSLFISMTGTVDEPVIKYDRQGAKMQLKENLAQEKQTLRQILREEFGLFKKDSTLNKKNPPKDDGKFIIKWDDEEDDKKKKKEDEDF